MRKIFVTLLILMSIGVILADQYAYTEDGRKVLLKDDNTWEYFQIPQEQDWKKYVDYTNCYYDFGTKAFSSIQLVKLEFVFLNKSATEIVGLEYDVKFLDAFGDLVYITHFKDYVRIKPNEEYEPDTYWYFDEFKDAYKKIAGSARNKTLHTLLSVTRIAFDDGTVLNFEEKLWFKPSKGDKAKSIF